MGTIISALETGKPLVVLPRLAALGEHRNDHQVGTATHFSRFSCIRVADSENNVGNLIDELLLGEEESVQLQSSPATSQELLDGIRRFLAG
jgi:UDP-N-acetylglucosamine transferase subunit ALG13